MTSTSFSFETFIYYLNSKLYTMRRLFIFILVLMSITPVQAGSNITQRAVYLSERVVVIRFINMGVDAHWGNNILENAASGLPLLEDMIGAPLPPAVKSVEIYGKKNLGVMEWAVGYNDGNLVALQTDHSNPMTLFHELVHFWTIHYSIPWGLEEGYCELYADLCSAKLGYEGVIYPEIDWAYEYEELKNHKGETPLNSFDYRSPNITDEQVDYFYWASTVIMYNFYETVGEENLKTINRKVAQSSLDGEKGGTGIIHYIGIVREVTRINYAKMFMPVVFTDWESPQIDDFEEAVGRYYALSTLTEIPDTDEKMALALKHLVQGKLSDFRNAEKNIITTFNNQQLRAAELPEQEIIYPEKEKGFFSNTLLIAGIILLVVVVVALIFIISKIAKEEEEFEWEETPLKEGPPLWTPPQQGLPEETEELPELPDLDELTK